MRVLLGCSIGGSGHLLPLLDVAGALDRAGAAVTVLVPPSLEPAARASGLPIAVGSAPDPAVVSALWERVRRGPPDAVRGLIDRELFAGHALDAMREPADALCADLEPGLIVRESCEYATAIAATRSWIAQAQVGVSPAAIEAGVLGMVSARLEQRGPGVATAIALAPYLTAFPEPLDPSPWADTRRYRVDGPAAGAEPLGDWWPGRSADEPLVWVTFGTVLGELQEAASVFGAALDAVAGIPARVLVCVGRGFDSSALRTVPDNVRVEPWVAWERIASRVDLVVCHGGSGTTGRALAAGVPLVVCPLFADQTANATTVARTGAGIVVRPATPAAGGVQSLGPGEVGALRDAITRGLEERSYREAARGVAARIAATPSVDAVAAELLRTARASSPRSPR